MKKKIGILGSGTVGQSLANGFIKYDYQVMIGSRDISKLKDWKGQSGRNGFTGSFVEAASFGDILVLAVKGSAVKEVIETAGIENLKGKTIMDATNPIADKAPVNGVLKYFTKLDYSLMEELQMQAQEAHFVKVFSCIGSALMVNPDYNGIKPSMFICGNDENAKNEVKTILDLFGFEPEDMGDAEAARAIEPLAMLWCIPGFRENKWTHALKLLKPR